MVSKCPLCEVHLDEDCEKFYCSVCAEEDPHACAQILDLSISGGRFEKSLEFLKEAKLYEK